jgi:hypothetical protein
MPRIKWTKTVHNYSFTPPASISESSYNCYNIQIKNYPLCNLNDIQDKNKDNLMFFVLSFGIIGFILGLYFLLTKNSNEIPGWITFYFIISVFFIIHPIVNKGKLESFINKRRAEKNKQQFFDELKAMIMKSKSYSEFVDQYNKKYNPVFKKPY